jgi:hypothetical protein
LGTRSSAWTTVACWAWTVFAPLGAAATADLANLTEGTLAIGKRAGAFIRPDTSDWIDSPEGEFQLCIEGNGDAPF